jgi:hypothetical protein
MKSLASLALFSLLLSACGDNSAGPDVLAPQYPNANADLFTVSMEYTEVRKAYSLAEEARKIDGVIGVSVELEDTADATIYKVTVSMIPDDIISKKVINLFDTAI